MAEDSAAGGQSAPPGLLRCGTAARRVRSSSCARPGLVWGCCDGADGRVGQRLVRQELFLNEAIEDTALPLPSQRHCLANMPPHSQNRTGPVITWTVLGRRDEPGQARNAQTDRSRGKGGNRRRNPGHPAMAYPRDTTCRFSGGSFQPVQSCKFRTPGSHADSLEIRTNTERGRPENLTIRSEVLVLIQTNISPQS